MFTCLSQIRRKKNLPEKSGADQAWCELRASKKQRKHQDKPELHGRDIMQESHNGLVLTLRGGLFVCFPLNSNQEKSLNDAIVPREKQASFHRHCETADGCGWHTLECVSF